MEGQNLIRVMVAEDMQLLREDFCETIDKQSDMKIVGSAKSGHEICELARQIPCDIILMDIEMETMNAGIVATETIHQLNPDTKILFLTAHETDDMIVGAMSSGGVDYIVKGCDDAVLLEHVRRAYDNKTVLEPQIQQTVMQEYSRLRQSERSLLFFINNVARLTPAEMELVRYLLQGKKNAEIADARCVEIVTVKTQIKGLLKKFGCSRSNEIVEMIRRLRLEHLFQ